MTADPDSVIREHGPEAMQGVLDDAIPLRAHILAEILIDGARYDKLVAECHRRLTERRLIHAAARILAIVSTVRAQRLGHAEDRGAKAERSVIAAAARGMLTREDLQSVPFAAITGAGRFLAWRSAALACRRFARRATFRDARRYLGCAPLDLPRAVEIQLVEDAAEELDACEAVACSRRSVHALLEGPDARARRTLAALLPVLEALDRGEAPRDTGARLRAAAEGWK